MGEVTDSRWFQYVIAVGLALAMIALIGYARGAESADGLSPDSDVVVVVDRD